jgi:hypothetical protein
MRARVVCSSAPILDRSVCAAMHAAPHRTAPHPHLAHAQLVEHDHLVKAVDELGPEVALDLAQHQLLHARLAWRRARSARARAELAHGVISDGV